MNTPVEDGAITPSSIIVAKEELPPLPDDIHTTPSGGRFDPRAWFDDPALPFEIEIGCGKGTFILNESRERQDANFLGFEWEHEFFAYAADRLRRANARNVRMMHADAVEFIRWRCPDAIVRTIHLYFSDPWPKKRHHKRRVVQEAFLHECHRVLVPGGELRIVTDHSEYWEWMQEHFALVTPPGGRLFQRREFEPPTSAKEGELVGTNFERKYRREGRPFHSIVLRKEGPGDAPTSSQVAASKADRTPSAARDSIPVSETFTSIQGEGKLTGVPSFFIRVSGCNLRCTWCDTPYASWNPDGRAVEIDALVREARASGTRHVVLTGGEPMMFPQISALARRLKDAGFHITIETAGTIDRDDVPCDLMSISPKLASSTPFPGDPRDPSGAWAERHEARRINPAALSALSRRAPDVQYKFVVSAAPDIAEIESIVALLPPRDPCDVLLMPEGVAPPSADLKSLVVRECLRKGWRYCTRLHLDLFGNRRGT